MNRIVPTLCLCAATLVLGACASTVQTRYYTLAPPAAPAAPVPNAAFFIDVLPVDVPRQVDTQSLVLRAGDSRLQVLDAHRWAAPLADEIRDALSRDLTRALETIDVRGFSTSAGGEPVWRIRLVVRRFESVYGSHVVLDALWSLRKTGSTTPALTCHSHQVEPVKPGYAALARGHQRALARVATQIAAALQTLPAAVCPSGVKR